MIELRKRGIGVEGICLPGSRVEEYLKGHAIPSKTLPDASPASLRSVNVLKHLIRRGGVDVVHAHFHRDIWPSALALTFDEERKLFLSVYMGVPKKKDILHRFIYRRLNGLFTSSRELCRRLPSLYPVAESIVHYLPYGRTISDTPRDEEKRRKIREELGCGETDFLVGTMVRIDPGKCVMDFVGSFPYLDSDLKNRTRYLIIGEPTRKSKLRGSESPFEKQSELYLEDLKRFVYEQGIAERVIFAGYQSDVRGYLSAMDVFVFPSRDELYSLVVLDAMESGLAVVAAAAGGTLDQIEDNKSGLLYRVGDSKELAAQIRTYLLSPDLRRSHGAKARTFVKEHHSMDQMISRLTGYYEGNVQQGEG